jgi:prepilin-type N-terminal cleavage/methylation domain-containing protein
MDGYTLFELVIVITIIGIMTGTVSVRMGDVNLKARLSNATYRALADMRYAQELAMSERRSIDVFIYAGSDKYAIKYHDTGAYVQSPTEDGNLLVEFDKGRYKDVVITSTGINSRLTFTPTGEALIGGSRFSNDTSILFLNNGVYVAVTGGGLENLGRPGSGGCGSSWC